MIWRLLSVWLVLSASALALEAEVVGLKKLRIRQRPSLRAPILGRIPRGGRLKVISARVPSQDRGKARRRYPFWAKVRWKGKVGFVARAYLRFPPLSRRKRPKSRQSARKRKKKKIYLAFYGSSERHIPSVQAFLKRYHLQGVFFLSTFSRQRAAALVRSGHQLGVYFRQSPSLTQVFRHHRQLRRQLAEAGLRWMPRWVCVSQSTARLRRALRRSGLQLLHASGLARSATVYRRLQNTSWLILPLQAKTGSWLKGFWRRYGRHLQVLSPPSTAFPLKDLYSPQKIQHLARELSRKKLYHPLYRHWAKHYRFSWLLLKALAAVESSEEPRKVNPLGYYGLFQIGQEVLDDYNREERQNLTLESLLQVENNVAVGAWLLARNRAALAKVAANRPFWRSPYERAKLLYCAHNFGLGLVLRALKAKPHNIWEEVRRRGEKEYGRRNCAIKLAAAEKFATLYQIWCRQQKEVYQ